MEKRRCEREVCGPLEATSASLFVESRQHLTQCVPSNDNSILIAFNAQKVHAEVYAAKMICWMDSSHLFARNRMEIGGTTIFQSWDRWWHGVQWIYTRFGIMQLLLAMTLKVSIRKILHQGRNGHTEMGRGRDAIQCACIRVTEG